MDIEEIFDIICQHFITKKEYFEIFGHQEHLSAMEGWIRGEIVWLMHQSPLKEQDIFIATGKGIKPGIKSRRPDLQLKIHGDIIFVELKALVIDPKSYTWDFIVIRQLVAEFNSLSSMKNENNSSWFISFTYSLTETHDWEHIVDQAIKNKKIDLNNYSVKNIKNFAFDIGDNKQCLISLFGLHQP